LLANKIEERVDDTIFLNLKFVKNIEHLTETSKVSSIGGLTPV